MALIVLASLLHALIMFLLIAFIALAIYTSMVIIPLHALISLPFHALISLPLYALISLPLHALISPSIRALIIPSLHPMITVYTEFMHICNPHAHPCAYAPVCLQPSFDVGANPYHCICLPLYQFAHHPLSIASAIS